MDYIDTPLSIRTTSPKLPQIIPTATWSSGSGLISGKSYTTSFEATTNIRLQNDTTS